MSRWPHCSSDIWSLFMPLGQSTCHSKISHKQIFYNMTYMFLKMIPLCKLMQQTLQGLWGKWRQRHGKVLPVTHF
jgi:hypothetical protein